MTTTDPHDNPADSLQPVAAVLAAVFPGAGHFFLGYRQRGVLIAVGVLGLFFGGLLIGGLAAVDRREEPVWFLGQLLTGPIALLVDTVHQDYFKIKDPMPGPRGGSSASPRLRTSLPTEYRDPATGHPHPINVEADGSTWVSINGKRISPAWPPYVRGVGRMQELGMLFCTVAGFMNLICIIDAAMNFRAPRTRSGRDRGASELAR